MNEHNADCYCTKCLETSDHGRVQGCHALGVVIVVFCAALVFGIALGAGRLF